MSPEDFSRLSEGNRICSNSTTSNHAGHAYIIAGKRYGDRVVAVHVIDVMNPAEWVTGAGDVESILQLNHGDIIRNKGSNNVYIVTSAFPDHALAVHTIEIGKRDAGAWRLVTG